MKPLIFQPPKPKREQTSWVDNKLAYKKIKIWKPNIFLRLMYKLKILKDPRYNGKKLITLNDEIGQFNFDAAYIHQFSEGKNIKLLFGAIYIRKSKNYLWFRIFGKYGLHIKNKTQTIEMFSERYGYSKYLDIGKYRIKFLK